MGRWPMRYPVVAAPMAGGVSTPALAAAVSAAGGLGFLAAGYIGADRLVDDLAAARRLTMAPLGVNIFVPGPPDDVDREAVAAYGRRLAAEGGPGGARPGEARWDDDEWEATLAAVEADPPEVVSFTFGCPDAERIARLRERGSAVWVTVNHPDEAILAEGRGADAVVAQGHEAGGHRGGWDPAGERAELGLLPLLRACVRAVRIPVVAAGGIGDAPALAAVLAAGARAGQLGTAFMLTPEAGTDPTHRAALAEGRDTVVTRAFTGRRARGLRNDFIRRHDAAAPAGYPWVQHMTAPLRAAAKRVGDAEAMSLWAGQAHAQARPLPAGELVERLVRDARVALGEGWPGGPRP